MNLREAVELCFTVRPKWANGKSTATHRTNTNHCLRILGDDLDISTIRPSTFTKLGKKILEEGKQPGTANRIMQALHTVLHEAELEGEIDTTPTYRRFPEPPPLKEHYKKDELRFVLDKCLELEEHGQLMQQTLTFIYFTGCREGEAIGLMWDGVNWDDNFLTFLDTKNGTDHTITMHPVVRELLERMHLYRLDDSLVFQWESRYQLINTMRKLKKLAGISHRRPVHALRHTCATDLVTAGVDIRSIQGLLNHKDINTTLRYADATSEAIANAVSNITL